MLMIVADADDGSLGTTETNEADADGDEDVSEWSSASTSLTIGLGKGMEYVSRMCLGDAANRRAWGWEMLTASRTRVKERMLTSTTAEIPN